VPGTSCIGDAVIQEAECGWLLSENVVGDGLSYWRVPESLLAIVYLRLVESGCIPPTCVMV
jgi:hypothetical protein